MHAGGTVNPWRTDLQKTSPVHPERGLEREVWAQGRTFTWAADSLPHRVGTPWGGPGETCRVWGLGCPLVWSKGGSTELRSSVSIKRLFSLLSNSLPPAYIYLQRPVIGNGVKMERLYRHCPCFHSSYVSWGSQTSFKYPTARDYTLKRRNMGF